MHLYYVLYIELHASIVAWMLWWCMDESESIIPVCCCCPSVCARARPRQKRTRNPDQN